MSPGARRVHRPSLFQRQPCDCTSVATDVAGTPSSSCATCAARNVGATTRDALPCRAATSIATPSIVVFPAPAAPSITTSGSVDATAAAARSCPASRPRLRAVRRTSGCSRSCCGMRAAMRSRSSVSACTTLSEVRCATCSGVGAPGGRIEKQSSIANDVATCTNSRISAGAACTPYSVMIRVACSCTVCRVHAEPPAAQRSSAWFATVCTERSSSDAGARRAGRRNVAGS